MTATTVARDVRPPLVLVRVLNPVMRTVLRTPFGRLVRPLALLEVTGRHSGRRYRVPVGWHDIEGGPAVFTPAPWRVNLRDGAPVTVWHGGRRQRCTAVLDADPASVAAALQSLLDRRGSLRSVGIDLPPGQRVTAADVEALDRAVIRLR
jgi:hypothetical protein